MSVNEIIFVKLFMLSCLLLCFSYIKFVILQLGARLEMFMS